MIVVKLYCSPIGGIQDMFGNIKCWLIGCSVIGVPLYIREPTNSLDKIVGYVELMGAISRAQ